jgi:hydrogenase maturation protein HypF
VAACLAENELEGPALGISWDGTGLGSDGTIWGGEFIVMHRGEWKRVGHLRTFCLPGGEAAVKEPRRCALGMLHAMYGPALWVENAHPILELFTPAELKLLRQMLAKSLNSPVTSSMGRLFDGVAALVLAKSRMNFEGQAAMELEWAIQGDQSHESYPFALVPAAIAGQPEVLDWAPTIEGVLNDLRFKVVKSRIAVKFHNTMAEMAVAVARRVGEPNVALTGGFFQNRYLTARTVERLRAEGFIPCWHQRVPPNDGGIALGQAVMAGYQQIK